MRTARTLAITIAVALVLVLVSGCSGDSEAGDTTSATSLASSPPTSQDTTTTTTPPPTTIAPTTSTTSTTSTTAATSTTLVTVTTPSTTPSSSTGGPVENEDWVAIIQHLVDIRFELNGAPDPSRAGEVYAVGSEPWQLFENQLANKQKDGQRTVDQDPQVVLSAERTFTAPDDGDGIENVLVTVRVQVGPNNGRIIDSNGNTVYELVPDPPTPPDGIINGQYGLIRFGGGPWLIATQSRL